MNNKLMDNESNNTNVEQKTKINKQKFIKNT